MAAAGLSLPEPAPSWRRPPAEQGKRVRTRERRSSRVLVGLDQHPVGIARGKIAAEGPQVTRLDRVAQRTGDDLSFGVARDRGDVRLETDGEYRGAALGRSFGDHRLLDRDQPVVEREPILLVLLNRGGERFIDVIVDMRADCLEIALPEAFEDQ